MNKRYETPSANILPLENEAVVMSGIGGDNMLSWTEYGEEEI